MNLRAQLSQVSGKALGLIAMVALAAVGSAQVAPYKVSRTSTATVVNSRNFSPQIKPYAGYYKEVENVFNFMNLPAGTPNGLTAGGINANLKHELLAGAKFPAIDSGGSEPPDPDLGVGPNHVIATVNVAIAFFSKTGTKQFERGLNEFFSAVSPGSFVFDPKCFYDPISQRYYVVALDVDFDNSESYYLVGVSDDNDPNGNWFQYKISNVVEVNSDKYWIDYPGFGHNKDHVVISGNAFGFDSGTNGVHYLALKKSELTTGAAATTQFLADTATFTTQIMRGPDNTTSTVYGIGLATNSSLKLTAITFNGSGVASLQSANVQVPAYTRPQNYVQSTGGKVLDPLDGRILNAYYRNGRITASHTIRRPNGTENASRWYEVNTNAFPSGNPTLVQAGNVAAPIGGHFWMPAVAQNRLGDIAIVYSSTSSSQAPGMFASYRKSSDPLGSMTGNRALDQSQAPVYGGFSSRWGDYFGLCVDPTDDLTFWGIGMVAGPNGGRWRTVVNSFRFITPTGIGPTAISMSEGRSSAGVLNDAKVSDNRYFSINSKPVQRLGEVASALVTFVPAANLDSGDLVLEGQAVASVAMNFFAYNWATQKYDYFGAGQMSTTDKVFTVKLPLVSRYRNSTTGQMRFLLRGINPNNTLRTATPFTLKIDRVAINGLFF